MFEDLSGLEDKYLKLEAEMSDPEIVRDQKLYQKAARQHSELAKIVTVYRRLKKSKSDLEDARELLNDGDAEIRKMAHSEIEELEAAILDLEQELTILLLPKDPNDEKNVVLEIRAGTGGEEAGLFVADLFRMYSRFSEVRHWKVDILSSNPTGAGGFKEIIALIEGDRVYSQLKFESGVHRVQRVPTTESQGRIHTSAVTVAVLPEAEDVEVDIKPDEIKVDVYRSSGPGGQSVNTTDSAVRVTHLPTGLVVTCQDEKSQHKNKAKALKVLRARLLDAMIAEQQEQITEERRGMVGSGDRSERIRTYNFPQGRVTDHRIGLTLYRLESIMQGDIQEIIDGLVTHFQAEALKAVQRLGALVGAQGKPTTGQSDGPWTILKLIRWTTDFLGSKGVDTPRLDAEVLLADLLGLTRVQLYLQFDRPLNPEELSGYRERVKRRAAREPVAYIVGHKEFYSLDLIVGPEVLIPRPETELLVEETLALVKDRWTEGQDLRLADLGTGSGAVAIALATRLPQAHLWAVDIHGPALSVASANAERHGVGQRIDFVQGDLLEPLQAAGVVFHLIAANLPYVPTGAFADMAPDVRDYEPHRSLDGGADGLRLIERVVAGGRALLSGDGAMLLEVWPDHGPRLIELGKESGFGQVHLVKDLAGHDRIAVLDARGESDQGPWTKQLWKADLS